MSLSPSELAEVPAARLLTCRTYRAGEGYVHPRRKTFVRVPPRRVHLACEACEYTVDLAERVYGLHGVEEIRRRHLKTAHFTALVTGTVTLREEPR